MRESFTAFVHTPFGTALVAAVVAVLVGWLLGHLIAILKLKGSFWGYVLQVVVFFVLGYLLITLPFFNFSWLGGF